MKKTVAIFLTILMALSLVACGNSNNAANSGSAGQSAPAGGETIKVTMASIYSDQNPGWVATQYFEDKVNELLAGSGYAVEWINHINSTLGGEREIGEQMLEGSINGGTIGSFQAFLDFPTQMIDMVPYFHKDFAMSRAFVKEIGRGMLNEALAKEGLITLADVTVGGLDIVTKQGPINGPEDLKGVKIRVAEDRTVVALMEAFGVTPSVIPMNEVYTAIQQGMADGVFVTPAVIRALNLQDLTSHLTTLQAIFTGHKITFNLDWLNGLPQVVQDAFYEAATLAEDYCINEINPKYNKEDYDAINAAGCTVNYLTPEQHEKFAEVARSIWPMLEEQIGPENWKKMNDWREDYLAKNP